jgi:hypothetical protein
MAIGILYDVPNSSNLLADWSFANAVHHTDVSNAIFRLNNNMRIDQFILDPFDPDNLDQWSYLHQATHNAQNQILNIQGFDLTGVDFKDPDADALKNWIYAHAQEHNQMATILMLG